MSETPNPRSDRSKRRSRKHRSQKLTAQSLIKLMRKHATVTLFVTVALTGLLVGYMAIEMAA